MLWLAPPPHPGSPRGCSPEGSIDPRRSFPHAECMLERTASWCHRHRWLVLVTWLVAAVALTVAAGAASGAFADGGRLDGTDSQAAYDLLRTQFPAEAGDSANIVFHDDHGIEADRGVIDAYLAKVAALPRVAE